MYWSWDRTKGVLAGGGRDYEICGIQYIGETKNSLKRWFWEAIHCQMSGTPTSRTTKSTGRQPNSSLLSTHGTPDASRRPSKSSSTTLFHRTSVSSSAIFGDPYYGPRDLLYPKSTTQPRLRDLLHPKSTNLPSPSLCLLTTDSVQWAHTPPPTPRIPVPPVTRLHTSRQ